MRTIDNGLHYERYPAILEGYCDANWISNSEESKSISGYVFTLGHVVISWKFEKQMCISRFTMDSEIIGMVLPGEETKWLKNLLSNISLWNKLVLAISLHRD